ncbi:SICA antigen [Plasmodium coatneyi]|uniref:SICA antigen n=1 Tax=Plasmodium coatneyi TaxID=208452 RepID=A0A1B1DXY4_9APIC|nr:SICA antigen [Plasmodium coatneyi]ANQ07467.1 SICA antigen [Plasmodium coatneyi]
MRNKERKGLSKEGSKERRNKKERRKERKGGKEGKKERKRKDERRKGDEDCTIKDKPLCDRVKCVTTNWFKDRITSGKQPQTWCTFWNTDVKNKLNELSMAMTNTNTGEEGICKDIVQEKGDSPHKEANRKACEYITKGLKYIYGIREDRNTNFANQKKNNRIFGQTMGCLLLNIYADQLKEKSKGQQCEITEQRIKEMFNKGNGKKNDWCVGNNNGEGNCVECTRQEKLTCTLDVEEKLFNEKESKNCMEHNKNIEKKVEELLGKDSRVQRTLKSICKRNIFFLEPTITEPDITIFARTYDNERTYNHTCTFWDTDAASRLKELSEGITKEKEDSDIGSVCGNTNGRNTIITDTEKKACGFINAGLKYIYGRTESTGVPNKKKARNNRLTEQTMGCLFLNAYADKLIKELKRPCYITEKEIKDMFDKGNMKMDEWCFEKNNGNGDCIKCERDPNYKNCTLKVNDDLRRTDNSCYKDNDKVENEVEKVFTEGQKHKEKGPKIKEALDALTNINNNNVPLCNRVKCIYYRWGENRKDNQGYIPWNEFWEPDVRNRLKYLSNAMTKTNGTHESLCKNIQDGKSGPTSEEGKKACELIVKGLEHIYKIPMGTDGQNQQKKDDNLIFHRTFSCMLLNIFADEMKQKCPTKQEEIEKGINHAFDESAKIKEKILPCKEEGDMCPLCSRDKGYDKCKIQKSDGDTIKKRFDDMLDPKTNKDSEVKQALNTIYNICPKDTKASSASSSVARSDDLPEPVPGPVPSPTPEPPQNHPAAAAAEPTKSAPAPKKEEEASGKVSENSPTGDQVFYPRRSPRREEHLSSPPLGEQLLDHVGDQDGPHEYTLVKERKPRSVPTKTKRPKKQGVGRRVGRRTIIDIHFEVLDECQKGDTQLAQRDFFEILVEQFMGSNFMEEEKTSKEQILRVDIPRENVPMEQVRGLGLGRKTFVRKEAVPKEQVQCSDSGFRIWGKMQDIWKGLMGKLTKPLDDKIKLLCVENLGADFGVKINQEEKALCKSFFKLYYHMNGIPIDGTEQEKIGDAGMEENYLRCVVGMATLHQLFGEHKCFRKYTDYVSRVMSGIRTIDNVDDYGTLCRRMNFGEMKIGTKLYFSLGKRRRRHRREKRLTSPPLGEQLLAHVDDQDDGPLAYTLVKKRRQPRSVPTRMKRPKEKGVGRRTIIDIHLEVLDECQRGDLHSTEDFFEILVQEFMGNAFINEEQAPKEDVPKEQVQDSCLGSDSGFRVHVPKEKDVQSSGSGFREKEFLPKEKILMEEIPKEQFSMHKIWDDLKEIFDDMVGTLWLGSDIIDGLCTGRVTEENKNWTNEDKELCKISVKILLYIDGIKIGIYSNIVAIKGEENNRAVESYLRCIVGRTLLIKWFGGHCSRMKVAETVLKAVEGWTGFSTVQGIHEKCEGLDFKNLNIGGRYIWPQMEEWGTKTGGKWQVTRGVQKMNTVKKEGENCGTPKKGRKAEPSHTTEDEDNLKKVFGVNSKDELDRLVQDKDKWDKEDLEAMIPTICMYSLNNVYWGDVEKRLGQLSETMTKNGKTDLDLCKTITVTDGSSVEANRKACNYIVSGLKHIYEIKKGSPPSPQNAVDNQIFERTFSCVLLNAYADKLENDLKSTCPLEAGINKSFGASAKIKEKITECKDDPNCLLCGRDETYKGCTVGTGRDHTNVKEKVDKMLEQDQQIKKTLSTITTLCKKNVKTSIYP